QRSLVRGVEGREPHEHAHRDARPQASPVAFPEGSPEVHAAAVGAHRGEAELPELVAQGALGALRSRREELRRLRSGCSRAGLRGREDHARYALSPAREAQRCRASTMASRTRARAGPPTSDRRSAEARGSSATASSGPVSNGWAAASTSAGSSESSTPRVSASRTRAPTTWCASRNGTPRTAKKSA